MSVSIKNSNPKDYVVELVEDGCNVNIEINGEPVAQIESDGTLYLICNPESSVPRDEEGNHWKVVKA